MGKNKCNKPVYCKSKCDYCEPKCDYCEPKYDYCESKCDEPVYCESKYDYCESKCDEPVYCESKYDYCEPKCDEPVYCEPKCIINDTYITKEVTYIHPVIHINREHIRYVPRHVYEEKTINEVVDPGYPDCCEDNKKDNNYCNYSRKKRNFWDWF